MTCICAIRATNGILIAADSLEIQTGAIARWDDFIKLLEDKGVEPESDEALLKPSELKNIFKPERIKNTENNQKIFPLNDKALLLAAGHSKINEKTIEEICHEIETSLKAATEPNAESICEITHSIIKEHLDADTFLAQDQKELCEYLLCVRENNSNKIFRLKYYLQRGTEIKTFSSVGDDYIQDIVNIGGSPGAAKDLTKLNQIAKWIPNPLLAYKIAQSIIEMAVVSEKLSQEIPGVGGNIYYMFLFDKGWKFITNEGDLLNCI